MKDEKMKMKNKLALLFLFLFAVFLTGILFSESPPTITTFVRVDGGLPSFAEALAPIVRIITGPTGPGTQALFDIALEIPPRSAEVTSGKNLLISVALTNFGSGELTNISLNYIVTNSRGDVVFIEHEKNVVETQYSFLKALELPNLNKGQYQVFAELLYSNTSAIASEKFKII